MSICLFLTGTLALLTALPGAEVSFYCPFDKGVEATHASGSRYGTCRTAVFAEGRTGKAVELRPGRVPVGFRELGNLDKAQGSIELWIQADWGPDDRSNQVILWEEGPWDPGNNSLWFWKYGTALRFDVRDPGDHYLTARIGAWKGDEWHHLVATWDCHLGTRLYIDARLAASRDFAWTPQFHTRLLLGDSDRSDRPVSAALDEIYIYTSALTPEEVRMAFEGQLKRTFRKPLTSPKPAPPRIGRPVRLFYLPLDGDCRATEAGGSARPKTAESITFAAGVRGQAAHFGQGSRLVFRESGNLNKERGSLLFWFRPDWSGNQARSDEQREIWRCLFTESPVPPNRHGSNRLWFWVWGTRLRFDVSNFADSYLTQPIVDWRAGEWHHLAATWDNTRDRKVYVDGRVLRGGRDRQKPFLPLKWAAHPFPEFIIGSEGLKRAAHGSIDELKIYDGPLDETNIRAEVAKVFPTMPETSAPYLVTGQTARLKWRLRSLSLQKVAGTLDWRLHDPNGNVVLSGKSEQIEMKKESAHEFAVPFTPASSGEFRLECQWLPSQSEHSSGTSISFWASAPSLPQKPDTKLSLKLIETLDCTQPLAPDKLVSFGQVRLVKSPEGLYLEAGENPRDRFALRVRLPHENRQYVVDWEYPDDKPRTMEMIAQSVAAPTGEYELQTGAFCGGEYPLSNRMLTQRSFFWPRDRDIALILMTAEQGRPAAAARIHVYEVQGRLPKLPARCAPPVNGWPRMVGLYYEDPAFCYDFGGYDAMPGFALTVNRLMDLMDSFGQNLFMYPGVWYNGPLYPSKSQGTAMARPHPENFIRLILQKFGPRGLYFIPTFNVHNLPSLALVKWDEPASLAGDAMNTPIMLEWDGSPNLSGWHGTTPNYNVLHPNVQKAILAMVDELLALYGDSPAFKGICFHLTQHCLLWFGSLDAGYNLYCLEDFQQDTGTKLPLAKGQPGTINRAYRWIMAHARDEWIAWRCRKLRDLYGQIAERMRQRRADLKLVLNLYQPTKTEVTKDPGFSEIADYVGKVNREAGVDAGLYRDTPNIVIQRTIYPADYRWQRAHRRNPTDPIAVRELNYEPRHFSFLRNVREVWINMHDRYWEDAVGRSRKWKAFWGQEMGWRVSTLNPNQNHCLESYVIPLARMDSMAFTKGGFLVGTTGIEKQVGRFARTFRTLPARKFHDLPGNRGPVVVRYLPDKEGLYLYLVNPTWKEHRVPIQLQGEVRTIRHLLTGESSAVGPGIRRFIVPGYGLETFYIGGRKVAVEVGQ